MGVAVGVGTGVKVGVGCGRHRDHQDPSATVTRSAVAPWHGCERFHSQRRPSATDPPSAHKNQGGYGTGPKRKGQRKAVRMSPSVVEPEFQYMMNLERYHCAKVVLLPPLPIPPTPETSP